MKIGVDLDGCAYDFGQSIRAWMNYSTGQRDLPESSVWNIWEAWGMDMDTWMDHFRQGVAAGHVFRDGDPHEGTKQALDYLQSRGHTLHIVTYRKIHPRAIQSTQEWLDEHQIPFDTITFSKDKTIIPVDVFIEDNADNALQLAEAGTRVALLDRPWNRECAEHFNITRMYSWAQFALAVDRLEAVAA